MPLPPPWRGDGGLSVPPCSPPSHGASPPASAPASSVGAGASSTAAPPRSAVGRRGPWPQRWRGRRRVHALPLVIVVVVVEVCGGGCDVARRASSVAAEVVVVVPAVVARGSDGQRRPPRRRRGGSAGAAARPPRRGCCCNERRPRPRGDDEDVRGRASGTTRRSGGRGEVSRAPADPSSFRPGLLLLLSLLVVEGRGVLLQSCDDGVDGGQRGPSSPPVAVGADRGQGGEPLGRDVGRAVKVERRG